MLDEHVVKGWHVKGFFLAFIPDPNDPPPYPPRAPIPLLSDLARWGRVRKGRVRNGRGKFGWSLHSVETCRRKNLCG